MTAVPEYRADSFANSPDGRVMEGGRVAFDPPPWLWIVQGIVKVT